MREPTPLQIARGLISLVRPYLRGKVLGIEDFGGTKTLRTTEIAVVFAYFGDKVSVEIRPVFKCKNEMLRKYGAPIVRSEVKHSGSLEEKIKIYRVFGLLLDDAVDRAIRSGRCA